MGDTNLRAAAEYARLCRLIGKPPLGDCQLVSLMIANAIDGKIVSGFVLFDEGERWHFWAEDDCQQRYDPLANDWNELPISYRAERVVCKSEILDELSTFLMHFDYWVSGWQPPHPLRFALGHELLGWACPGSPYQS